MQTIKVNGQQAEVVRKINAGLKVHCDSDGSYGGRRPNRWAMDADGQIYKTNRSSRWVKTSKTPPAALLEI